MNLGIQFHLTGLSLSETVSILDNFGIDRCRSAVHNWVQKADFEPRVGRQPEQIVLSSCILRRNDSPILKHFRGGN